MNKLTEQHVTNPLHEEVLHLRLDGVEELHLAVAVMVLEVHDHVHHDEHLRRKHVVRPASTFLQPQLKRLQRPTTQCSTLQYLSMSVWSF